MSPITFKTITQQSFELELENNVTIAEVKQKIATEKGENDFPVDGQKLIYNGKVLDDTATIGELNIAEKKFVVVMVTKKKEPSPPKTEPSKEQSQAVVAKTPNAAVSSSGATDSQSTSPAASLEIPQEHTGALDNLQAMGYPREEAIRALRASFFDADRAVEYLCNGIPDGLNLGEAGAGVEANLVESDEDEADPSGLAFLQASPQFQQLRDIVRTDPAMLQQIIQQISMTNPELMNIIQNNQAEFLQLLNSDAAQSASGTEPAAQAPAGARGDGPQRIAIPVTPEDREALQRLKALGFPEALVIEAYFACDKNEDLAANYILQRMDEFNQEQAD